jgi:hypothetical protein
VGQEKCKISPEYHMVLRKQAKDEDISKRHRKQIEGPLNSQMRDSLNVKINDSNAL